MASTPLFDITPIDLDHVVLTAEQIEALNPQRGDMRQLDAVVWSSEDRQRLLGVKHVRDDEFWVPGHIPGRPLYPGVLMIEAGAQLSSLLYKLKSKEERFLGFTRCDHVSFRGQVVPGDTLHVLAQELSFGARRCVCLTQGMVDGQLVFEAKITGMVM
ncbi:MAG: 3-hydroxyacyl-ACP dehydratase FabZ family protein [Planctomycetota bacterium]